MKTDIYPRFSLATIDRAASRRTCAAPTRRHIFMQTVLPDSLSNAETTNPDLFEITPTSLWLEDYSQLRVLFDQWKSQGVTDLVDHLERDPAHLAACFASARVLRVNQRTLSLFGAESFDELTARLHEVLRDDMIKAYMDELEQLWQGHNTFQSQTMNYALNGPRLDDRPQGLVRTEKTRVGKEG